LHLLFSHITRGSAGEDKAIVNIAADLVVNQYIGGKWRLPDDAVTLKSFSDLELEPERDLGYYYERIRRLRTAAGKKSAPESARTLAGIERWHSDHSLWDERGEAPARAAIDRLVRRSIERLGARGHGDLPGPLNQLIAAALERTTPQVSWRRVLRLFGGSSRRTRIQNTIRCVSRRYGVIPGIRVRRRSRIAVAVDTSGSVSDAELAVFFSEIDALRRQGAEVWVIEADAAVQRVYPYAGRFPTAIAGRGGTAFDPVFRHLARDHGQRWDGCIYFTDGAGPAPRVRPPCALLWVLSANGQPGEHLRYGRTVKLDAR
jgi:predicted metal-dependent peptidase